MKTARAIWELKRIAAKIKKLERKYPDLREKELLGYPSNFDSKAKEMRPKHLALQYDYNAFIDSHDVLKPLYKKIVIDTLDLHWDSIPSDIKMYEAIAINLEKRSEYSPGEWTIIGETEEYIFFHYVAYFFRKDKKSNEIVYFGKGGNIAAIIGQWIYWCELGAIIGDRYIHRITTDGKRHEKIDCLNNEKCIGFMNHLVSKENISAVTVEDGWIVFTVYSHAIGGYYELCMTDIDGKNVMKKRPHKDVNKRPRNKTKLY